jgi:hypothetical protein
MNILVLFPLLLLLAGEPKPGDTDPAPEKVALASFAAQRKLDWEAYADLMHPEGLNDFKGLLAPVLRAAEKKGREEQAGLLTLFHGARDLKTALAWEPKEFFLRFQNATASRYPLKDNFTGTTAKVLGKVPEGANQTHVVVRVTRTMGKTKLTRVEVVTVKRSGGAWKVAMPEELRGLAETIKRTAPPEKIGPIVDSADQ